MPHDFPSDILQHVAHRPWPMPDGPWIMTQSWHDLLFAHWPVDVRTLRSKVPPGFELDLFDRQAWIGILPFQMTNVAPRGVPAVPWVSEFPELNVRTYVTVGDRPGIYFFSLDAGSTLAATLGRRLFHLPYYTASMDVREEGSGIRYTSRRTTDGAPPAEWRSRYAPTGPEREPGRGSLEHFLTERYCLYTLDQGFRAYRLEIHHPPWRLQRAEADIVTNTMAEAAGIPLPDRAPLLHYAKRQDAVAWPLTRMDGDDR